LIATVAVETGISPNDLLDTPSEILLAIIGILKKKSDAYNRAMNRRRGR